MPGLDAVRVLEDVITTRRSVRRYTDARVDINQLMSLVRLGIWAPTGGNAQTWGFVVVTDETVIRAIHAVSPGISTPPPAIIAICQDRKRAEEKGGVFGRDRCAPMDAAMAAQTMMLAAHAEGLGTCAVLSFHPRSVREILALPEQIVPELLLTVGYPAKVPPPPTRASADIIHVNRWERRPARGSPEGFSRNDEACCDDRRGDAR